MEIYSYRKSLFSKQQTFSLEENTLSIEQEAVVTVIPYKDIDSIRLMYIPDRMRPQNFLCTITSGDKKYSFMASSYISLANFKDDKEGYRNFVYSLIKKVHKANPSVSLLSGRPKHMYWISIVAILFILCGLAVLIYYVGTHMSAGNWIKYLLILLLMPMALSYIQRNKPGTFTPDDIPDKLLPKVS